MAAPRSEKWNEKYAWVLLFAFGIYGSLYALASIVVPAIGLDAEAVVSSTGMTWDELVATSPGFANYILYLARGSGVNLLPAHTFAAAIAAVPYKKGERWSWYAFWMLPITFAGAAAIEFTAGASLGTVGFELGAVAVYLSGLLLPYRKFFPRTRAASS